MEIGDFKDLSSREIQLLTLMEMKKISDKMEVMDRDLKEAATKIAKLENFRSQVLAALVVVNAIWAGVAVFL